jgi:hypothetical protein
MENILLGKEELIIDKLLTFYSNPSNLKVFIEVVVNQGTMISLRLLDWFSTNYSKNNRIYISNVDIHSNYKNQLKGYKKQYFDPFCRRKRILLKAKNCDIRGQLNKDFVDLEYKIVDNPDTINMENGILTTIGQLNFFKWCIDKKILYYIMKNSNDIEKSMSKMNNKGSTSQVYKTIKNVTIKFN